MEQGGRVYGCAGHHAAACSPRISEELDDHGAAEDETGRGRVCTEVQVKRECHRKELQPGGAVQCIHQCCIAEDKAHIPFADIVVKHVVINCLHDMDIRREVLGVPDLDDKSLAETIGIIESKENSAEINVRQVGGRQRGGGRVHLHLLEEDPTDGPETPAHWKVRSLQQGV